MRDPDWYADEELVLAEARRQRLSRTAGLLTGSGPRAHVEYQTRPIDWIVDVLGVSRESLVWSSAGPEYEAHEWDGTPDPMVAIADGLAAGEDVGVESGTGTGKSFLGACLLLWWLAAWQGSRVYTYAPKEDQLRLFLWAEVSRLWRRFQRAFPTAVLTDLRIRMDGQTDTWAAHGYAVRVRAGEESATGAQGAHAEHLLIITEETPGIDGSVMEAVAHTRTAPHNLHLALGNPDSQHDALHQFCSAPGVRAVRVSGLDHPNVVTGRDVVPGAVGLRRVQRARAEAELRGTWRMYESRIRGISPEESAEAMIRAAWCRDAVERWALPQYRRGLRALGVDVAASESGDRGVIARGIGACLLEVEASACPDPVAFGLRVGVEVKRDGIDPYRVGVDSVGVGAGAVGRLAELGYRVRALNGGGSAEPMRDYGAKERTGRSVLDVTRYRNLRSQMWWQMRLDLQRGEVALPDDPELIEDLTAVEYELRGGMVVVEEKESVRDRLGRSPDKGDAAVYWNWVRARGPVLVEEERPILTVGYDAAYDEVMERLEGRVRKRAF